MVSSNCESGRQGKAGYKLQGREGYRLPGRLGMPGSRPAATWTSSGRPGRPGYRVKGRVGYRLPGRPWRTEYRPPHLTKTSLERTEAALTT